MSYSQELSQPNSPFLETKLYPPKWRIGMVQRPRLLERLLQGRTRKLTIITAPAGFGKTTLLAEWLGQNAMQDSPFGWVSLDERDNDPVMFWSYFIQALQKMHPGAFEDALMMLQAPRPSVIEGILTLLINEIHALERNVFIALDDYHLIHEDGIHEAMAFLLDNLPPRLHLVIASRSVPALPLARLRARNNLVELHASDLRFSPDEAAAFLNDLMRLNLSAGDIQVLENKTEGWIAGLQLAALSIQGRANTSALIGDFAGDDRYIIDYLVEEVLAQQPVQVQDFLLHTSILDRLSAPLCDAVTGQDASSALLERIEQNNLFLIPLDDKRHWYRYHHLFSEVLLARLKKKNSTLIPSLHRRASEWYGAAGYHSEAVKHALASGDDSLAASAIEQAARIVFSTGQGSTLNVWLDHIPADLLAQRPVLSTWFAWKCVDQGHMDAAVPYMNQVESWYKQRAGETSGAPTATIIIDEAIIPSIPGMIATSRALVAQARGNIPEALAQARYALEVLPEDDYLWMGGATAILGLAVWSHGDLEEAYESFAQGLELTRADGKVHYFISGTHVLCKLLIGQGKLQDARKTYLKSLALAEAATGPPITGTADLYRGLSEMACESNDLEEAERYFTEGRALGTLSAVTEYLFHWHLVEARLKEARGNLAGALHCLEEADRSFVPNPFPDAPPIAAMKVRLWLLSGQFQQVIRWMGESGVSTTDDLSYLREYEHITLCRVLITLPGQDRIQEAIHMLERLLSTTRSARRFDHALMILIQLSLAYHALRDTQRALAHLEQAFALAEPEGYFRIFIDEGVRMHELLRHAAAAGTGAGYARSLLQTIEHKSEQAPGANEALSFPLSPREIEILRLIASGMKNQQIADHLFISLATVKRHIANLYGKMEVSHRTEAVRRATELGLI